MSNHRASAVSLLLHSGLDVAETAFKAMRHYRAQHELAGRRYPHGATELEHQLNELASNGQFARLQPCAIDTESTLVVTGPVAAGLLGVSHRTVRRLAASGQLQTIRINRRVFIRTTDLLEYIDQRGANGR